jgi:hypothetical protein
MTVAATALLRTLPRDVRGALRVIKLNTGKVAPAEIGEINFCVVAVDGELACAPPAPIVGLLLYASRNERTFVPLGASSSIVMSLG